MMDDMGQFLLCIGIGVIFGMLFAWGLISLFGSLYVHKETLKAKQTISMDKFYGQYSCVRRFPK